MPLGSAVDQRPRIPCLSKRRGAGGCSNTLSDQPGRPGRGVSRLFKAWVCPRGHRPFKRLFFDLCAPLAVHMSQRAIVGSTRRQGLPAKSPPRLVLFKGALASEARQAEGEVAVVKVAPTRVHVVNAWRCPHVPRRAGLSTASTGMTVAHHRPCGPQGRSAAPEQQFAINSIA